MPIALRELGEHAGDLRRRRGFLCSQALNLPRIARESRFQRLRSAHPGDRIDEAPILGFQLGDALRISFTLLHDACEKRRDGLARGRNHL